MNLVLVVNPQAGRGRGSQVADEVSGALERDGHAVRRVLVGAIAEPPLAEAVSGSNAIVVVGGDGTVHHAAEAAIAAAAPIYHVPLGTENLFAREFGMTADPRQLLRALRRGRLAQMDAGRLGGRRFLIMCSVGCDAGVIGRMAARREGSIGHLSYLGPMLSEAWSPSLSPMTISVDGRTVVEGRRGLAVIANSRQYALRVDPALRASVSDGLLDVVFFPGASSAEMLLWVLRSRLRRHVRSRRLEYRTGRSVVVTDHGGALPTQLDGEAAARTQGEIAISVEPGALAVLLP